MMLNRWNDSTASLMTDPRLLEVPRELIPLMNICVSAFFRIWLGVMHSTQVPTDGDLQQYLHVFFTSPDIWHASVLEHSITPPFLRKFNKKVMIPFSKILCLMNLGILTNEWYSTWMFSGIKALQRLGTILSCPSPPEQSC